MHNKQTKKSIMGGKLIARQFVNMDDNLLRLIVIAALVFVVMSMANPGKFITSRNFTSMSFQFPELGILALAVMLSLITAGIDLSVVGIANLTGIVAALVLTDVIAGNPYLAQTWLCIPLAIIVATATGFICGLLNGFLISTIGITPILATLGTMQLYTGLAFVITKGPAIYGYPDIFLSIGNSTVGILPVPLIIFVILALSLSVMLSRTRFGINLYLVGTNEIAARFSGINIKRALNNTYILSGLLSSIAGLIIIARTNSAKADYGSSYLLQAVLVAVLGGVNPNGGFGTVLGVFISVLSLQFLSSGFNMLRVNNFAKEFAWGALLLVIMVVHYYFNRTK